MGDLRTMADNFHEHGKCAMCDEMRASFPNHPARIEALYRTCGRSLAAYAAVQRKRHERAAKRLNIRAIDPGPANPYCTICPDTAGGLTT